MMAFAHGRRLTVGGPPAIWSAFVQASAWKSWVLVIQFFVIALLLLSNIRLARQAPDIVLVTPEGKSTYLHRSVAQDALLRFLDEQKGMPSDVTVLHFTKEFLTLAQAVNSSTIEEAWSETLKRMSPGMRDKFRKASEEQNLVSTYQALQLKTELVFEDITLVSRVGPLLEVRATVTRSSSKLTDGNSRPMDRLVSDLVLKAVPRTHERPDGLEVLDWRIQPAASKTDGLATTKDSAQ